jgi:hypothetical protein
MTTAANLQAALRLMPTERERLDQRLRDARKAERAHLYEPAPVSVLEWEGERRARREIEDRLERTLRQLATTCAKLRATQDELETLKAARL